MRHLREAESELCRRSLKNLSNQGVTFYELTQACGKEGWQCMRAGDNAFIAKSPAALEEFQAKHGQG